MANSDPTTNSAAEIKWGGIAGLIGSVLFGIVYIAGDLLKSILPDSWLIGFIFGGLILSAYLLWVPFFLVLYRVLRRHSAAAALFAVAFAVVGITILASVSHQGLTVSYRVDYFLPLISEVEITESMRETLLLAEMAITGTYLATISVGYIAAMAGILFFGIALLGSQDFGKGIGWTGIILGSVGLLGSIWLFIDQEGPGGIFAVYALILFNALAGWMLFTKQNQMVPE